MNQIGWSHYSLLLQKKILWIINHHCVTAPERYLERHFLNSYFALLPDEGLRRETWVQVINSLQDFIGSFIVGLWSDTPACKTLYAKCENKNLLATIWMTMTMPNIFWYQLHKSDNMLFFLSYMAVNGISRLLAKTNWRHHHGLWEIVNFITAIFCSEIQFVSSWQVCNLNE